MKKPTGSYPHVRVQGDGRTVVSQAGSVLLVETVRKSGLDQAVSAALAPWQKPRAVGVQVDVHHLVRMRVHQS
ncbi:transposase [Streptomyces flavidovirens]|uniref:transposase n=1 Tax=Streptomyces flavidovirens TaxID=67298 RepID=UPI0033A5FD48